jgi:hypothetical protein
MVITYIIMQANQHNVCDYVQCFRACLLQLGAGFKRNTHNKIVCESSEMELNLLRIYWPLNAGLSWIYWE